MASKATLISWIGYWDRASAGPRIDRVHTIADLETCRTYNPAMRSGVVADVSTPAMFAALTDYRRAA